jgi:hypothetical protein
MGPIRCPETSVKDYHLTLRNTPEERRSHENSERRNTRWPVAAIVEAMSLRFPDFFYEKQIMSLYPNKSTVKAPIAVKMIKVQTKSLR